MKYALNLGKLFGISLKVHWTFAFILLWVTFLNLSYGQTAMGIAWELFFVISIFGCVVLHELGHALAARRFGIPTKDITLYPIGGVARLQSIPKEPMKELVVAIAGPAVNVVIALILFIGFKSNQQYIENLTLLDEPLSLATFPYYLMTANIVLVIFNAIPAFPMDGGRVLRALLSMKLPRLQATRIAMWIGQFFAGVFIVAGLFYNPFLMLIGFFVFFGARSEYKYIKNFERFEPYMVKDAMSQNYVPVSTQDTINEAMEKFYNSPGQVIIVEKNGVIYGIVRRHTIEKYLKDGHNKQRKITTLMDKEFEVIDANQNLNQAYNYLIRKRDKYFPVMVDNRISGIISFNKIREFLILKTEGYQY
ncbi:site-2 protease family protein [Flexithrix dorotheae]|uniref:site-2 protease family protein n=1 Tax=Flexithrix dorotheae TaxID=70993 RepID=UPI000371CD08|nr:site-2 protease family protein [Flexithrix dorotheae]